MYSDSLFLLSELYGIKDMSIMALNGQAIYHKNKGDSEKAIGLFHQALKRTDSLSNSEGPKAMILANMSNIYTDIGAYKKSIATLDRLLVVTDTIRSFSKIKAAALVGQSINNTKLEDYEKGLEYGNRALELANYMGDEGVTASVLNNISDIYLAQKEFEKALDAIQKGLNLEVAKKPTKTRGWLLLNEGIALYNLSRFENSLSSFKASLTLAQEKELPLIEMYSYENLAKLYEQQENFEKSFQAQKEYSRIKNTIDGYNERNFYVGLAAPNAVGDLLSSEKNIELRVPYYGYAGYKLYLGAQEEFFLKPNALITVIQGVPKQVDMNMFVNYKSKVEAGIGYRTSSLINMLAGFYLFDNIRLNYTYNLALNDSPLGSSQGFSLSYRAGSGYSGRK